MDGVLVNQSSSISHTYIQPQGSYFSHSFSHSNAFSALMSWMIRPAGRAKGSSSPAQSLILKLCLGRLLMFNSQNVIEKEDSNPVRQIKFKRLPGLHSL